MPATAAPRRLASNRGSAKPVPWLALTKASAIPAAATAGQSIGPLWCDTSMTPSKTGSGKLMAELRDGSGKAAEAPCGERPEHAGNAAQQRRHRHPPAVVGALGGGARRLVAGEAQLDRPDAAVELGQVARAQAQVGAHLVDALAERAHFGAQHAERAVHIVVIERHATSPPAGWRWGRAAGRPGAARRRHRPWRAAA